MGFIQLKQPQYALSSLCVDMQGTKTTGFRFGGASVTILSRMATRFPHFEHEWSGLSTRAGWQFSIT